MTIATPHMQNRIALAERIDAYLDKHMPMATASNLMVLDEASWERIASLAGESKLSDGTITAVIALVRGQENLEAYVKNALARR